MKRQRRRTPADMGILLASALLNRQPLKAVAEVTADEDTVQGGRYQGPCPKCHGWVYCNDEGCACDTCGWIPPRR